MFKLDFKAGKWEMILDLEMPSYQIIRLTGPQNCIHPFQSPLVLTRNTRCGWCCDSGWIYGRNQHPRIHCWLKWKLLPYMHSTVCCLFPLVNELESTFSRLWKRPATTDGKCTSLRSCCSPSLWCRNSSSSPTSGTSVASARRGVEATSLSPGTKIWFRRSFYKSNSGGTQALRY